MTCDFVKAAAMWHDSSPSPSERSVTPNPLTAPNPPSPPSVVNQVPGSSADVVASSGDATMVIDIDDPQCLFQMAAEL